MVTDIPDTTENLPKQGLEFVPVSSFASIEVNFWLKFGCKRLGYFTCNLCPNLASYLKYLSFVFYYGAKPFSPSQCLTFYQPDCECECNSETDSPCKQIF